MSKFKMYDITNIKSSIYPPNLAKDNDVPASTANDILDRVDSVAAGFAIRSRDYPIRKATVERMAKVIGLR